MVRRVTSWAVFVMVMGVAWLLLAPTGFGGRNDYVIVDGTSMEPTHRNGDLVVTRQHETYAVGDVIAYQAPGDVDFPVIHRIVGGDAGGYITQGDNRDRADGWRPTDSDVYGAAWFSVPKGGHVLRFLNQLPVAMGLVAGWLVFLYLKHQEQDDQEDRSTQEGERPGSELGVDDELGAEGVLVGASPRTSRDELSQWLLSVGLDPDVGRRTQPDRQEAFIGRQVLAHVREMAPTRRARVLAGRRTALATVVGWALLAGLVVTGAGRVVYASSLKVDGGVLQTFVDHDIDHCELAPDLDFCGDG